MQGPEALLPKIHPESGEFTMFVVEEIRMMLSLAAVGDNSVVALFGIASLFGFARVSQVLKLVEGDVEGRLVVFFPGQYEQNNYRLLDARDGWNYMAVPITIHGARSAS